MPEQSQSFWNAFDELLSDFGDQALDIALESLNVIERLAEEGVEALRDPVKVLADQYRRLSEASSQLADAALERARWADELGLEGKSNLQDF
jgi:hypothetical protein